jgi:hypothetical protein
LAFSFRIAYIACHLVYFFWPATWLWYSAGYRGRVMTTPIIVGLVVLGIIVILLIVSATSKVILYSMKGPLEGRIAAQYGSNDILMKDLTANSFGLESAGVWQVRGNGALVLTPTELQFFQFLPKSDVRIPLDAITEVTFTRSHLGKATIYKLLKVRFTLNGKADSIAWFVADSKAWKERIEQLKRPVSAGSGGGLVDN